MELKPEEKTVFAITDDKKTVIIDVPEASWNYMKDGNTHTYDLNFLGVPVKIILFGGKDRAACLAPLKVDKDTLDVSGIDVGFGGQD